MAAWGSHFGLSKNTACVWLSYVSGQWMAPAAHDVVQPASPRAAWQLEPNLSPGSDTGIDAVACQGTMLCESSGGGCMNVNLVLCVYHLLGTRYSCRTAALHCMAVSVGLLAGWFGSCPSPSVYRTGPK
jgi:hypothetical protein